MVARCTMRSNFSVNLGRCDLPSGLSSLRVDQVRIAQSPYVRSEARLGKRSRSLCHFTLGSLPYRDLHLLSL